MDKDAYDKHVDRHNYFKLHVDTSCLKTLKNKPPMSSPQIEKTFKCIHERGAVFADEDAYDVHLDSHNYDKEACNCIFCLKHYPIVEDIEYEKMMQKSVKLLNKKKTKVMAKVTYANAAAKSDKGKGMKWKSKITEMGFGLFD